MRRWYVVRAKPKKESLVEGVLTRAGIEVYLPKAKAERRDTRQAGIEPYFPGYLFGRLDPALGELRMVSYTDGVQYILGYDRQPWPVPDEFVRELRARLANRQWVGAPSFRPGERVTITAGPLWGLEALVDSRVSPSRRVRILVRLLGRLCRAELDGTSLMRVGQAAGEAAG